MRSIIFLALLSSIGLGQEIVLPTSGVGTQINTIQTLNQVDRNKNETTTSMEQQEEEERKDLSFSYNDEAHRQRVQKIKRDEARKAKLQNRP